MFHHNGKHVELATCRSAAGICQDFQAARQELDHLQGMVGNARVRLKDLERSLADAISKARVPILWDGTVYRLDYSGSVYSESVVDAGSVRMSDDSSVTFDTASDAPDLSEAPC